MLAVVEVEQKVQFATPGKDEAGYDDGGFGIFVAVGNEFVHRLVEFFCLGFVVYASASPDFANRVGFDGKLSDDSCSVRYYRDGRLMMDLPN